MAENVYTGTVQGICVLGALDAEEGFCREIEGGSFSIDRHNIVKNGIGGQRHKRGGTLEATLNLTCVGVSKTHLAMWFPIAAGVQVTDFPDFGVQVYDGTTGQDWKLSDGQPSSITISLDDAPDAELTVEVEMKFATVAEQTAGTYDPVYLTVKGHTHNDIGVTIGAASEGVLSFALSNDLGAAMYNPATTKSDDSKAFPDGYAYTKNDVKLDAVTSNALVTSLIDDLLTEVAIAIACANGTAGEDMTITMATMSPDTFSMPVEVEGIVGFATSFSPGDGTQYNQVVFT